MKIKISLFALILFLVGCSNPSEGKIYGKDYKQSYTTTSMYCASYNTKGQCIMWMPSTIHHPECWRLHVRDENEKWTVCVDRDYWEKAQNESTWKKAS